MHVAPIDYAILAVYFVVVLGIGFYLKSRMRKSSDFLLAGRHIPAWAAGLAFVGVFMMPFYYGSKARSVPEYLRLRFDEKTRSLNAITFAVMTVLSSGISLFAMGKLFNALLGWNMQVSFAVSALVVLGYVVLGGLTSAIYNEVLQFGLIVVGFAPLTYLGLRDVGGWSGMAAKLPPTFTHVWTNLARPDANPLGVEWFGMVMGSASCCRSATGAPSFSSSSARCPPSRRTPRAARRSSARSRRCSFRSS
jgi:SSS family solute:Na+ symporter